MTEHDYEAAKILMLFAGIHHIQSDQGIESFDEMQEESLKIIDEILEFEYSGDNPNIKHGFDVIKFWHSGMKLIRQKISELSNPEVENNS